MKIFSGNSNKKLAAKIAGKLGLELSPVEIFVFPDLEKRIRIKESVLDQDCVIVQSASTPPDENYMELFIMVDALKRSGAKSITAIIPYLGYERQDHIFRDGEAVSLEVIANILKTVGVTKAYSFDLHSPKIPEIFQIPTVELSALPTFAEKIKAEFNLDEVVLVSPDMGGIRRIKQVSEMLGNIPYATITKNRDLASGEINDSGIDGDVRGRSAIVIDDMISTGKTMVEGAEMLFEEGAIKIFVYATHAILARDADKLLQHSNIERVVVSDTIDVPSIKDFPKLEVVSIAEVAAKALREL
jgi:ribose-phosphate pyrophosphokinase